MIPMPLNAIADVLGAGHAPMNPVITAVSTDTRTQVKDSLFIALSGERFDGHDYLQQATDSGAVAAVIERAVDHELLQLKVPNSLEAMAKLANHLRNHLALPTVSVTGSSGKTTVKQMIASILAVKHKVLATQANFNNEIGVPLTLFGLTAEHQFAVIEMGAAKPGDIDYTSAIVEPNVAIVTNIGAAHLEGLGSLEGVAKVKTECLAHIKPQGVAVLPNDQRFIANWQQQLSSIEQPVQLKRFQIDFEAHDDADYFATNIQFDQAGCAGFVANTPTHQLAIQLNQPGVHNIANALAAIAAAEALNVDVESIKQGLSEFANVAGRLQKFTLGNDCQLIDDSYNANPNSVKAAIDLLAQLPGKKALVLGDMAELGEVAIKAHQDVGAYAQEKSIDALYCCGPLTLGTAKAFGEQAKHFANQQQLIAALINDYQGLNQILVKGSRSSAMEQVVQALLNSQQKQQKNEKGE